jgi:hypothetical protein
MAFIGKIPEAVLSKLFTEFLDCLDLGKLDSALCNGSNRNEFLNIISDNRFIMCNYEKNSSESFLKWLNTRIMFVKLLSLEVGTNLISTNILENVENLEFSMSESVATSANTSHIINQCEVLVSVTFSGLYMEDMESYWIDLMENLSDAVLNQVELFMFICSFGPGNDENLNVNLHNFHLLACKIYRSYSFQDVVFTFFKNKKILLRDIISDIGFLHPEATEMRFVACGVQFDLFALMSLIKDHSHVSLFDVVASFEDEDDESIFKYVKSIKNTAKIDLSKQVLAMDIEVLKNALSIPLRISVMEMVGLSLVPISKEEVVELITKSNPGCALRAL